MSMHWPCNSKILEIQEIILSKFQLSVDKKKSKFIPSSKSLPAPKKRKKPPPHTQKKTKQTHHNNKKNPPPPLQWMNLCWQAYTVLVPTWGRREDSERFPKEPHGWWKFAGWNKRYNWEPCKIVSQGQGINKECLLAVLRCRGEQQVTSSQQQQQQ